MTTALFTTQLGVETNYGVGVTAGKKLEAISVTPSVSVERQSITPIGNKYAQILGSTRKWFTASYDGVADAHALPYILSSLVTATTATLVPSTTASYKWVFFPNTTSADTFKSYTFNCGSGSDAIEATGVVFSSLTMDFSRRRNEFSVSGDIMGKNSTQTTMDTLASTISTKPFLVSDMCIYMSSTYSGLSSGKLNNVLSGSIAITDRYADVWYVDSSQTGFGKVVENRAPVSLSLLLEATQSNLSLLDTLVGGARRFIRVETVGGIIEGTTHYTFTFDGAFELSGVERFEDSDGVFAFRVNFAGVQDATLDTTGGVFEATVITDFDTL